MYVEMLTLYALYVKIITVNEKKVKSPWSIQISVHDVQIQEILTLNA